MKKSIFKKWWFYPLALFGLFIIFGIILELNMTPEEKEKLKREKFIKDSIEKANYNPENERIDNIKRHLKANERYVSRKIILGWPLTVEDGILCNENGTIIFKYDSKIYSVNGLAISHAKEKGYLDIHEIWADDSVAIKEMIDSGIPKEKANRKKMMNLIDIGLKIK